MRALDIIPEAADTGLELLGRHVAPDVQIGRPVLTAACPDATARS
jgi:hypothetical protein